MSEPVCLICGKDIKFLNWGDSEEKGKETGRAHDQVDDAGNVEINFYYGSRHDMCYGAPAPLGHTEPYRAYICDDCFDREEIRKRLKNDGPKNQTSEGIGDEGT